jgi:tripartite-type tricarboxylate transporter receptor subunit TctC
MKESTQMKNYSHIPSASLLRIFPLGFFALLLGALLSLQTAFAQDASFPNRPIKLVVPLAPGGATDTVARIYAKQLSSKLNTPVVVENRVGAGGMIALDSMSKAPADGYTIFVGNLSTNALNETVFAEKIKRKPSEYLTGITTLAIIPHIFVASAQLGINSIPELITYAKRNPDTINHASPGVGTYSMLDMLNFEKAAGLKMTHVPYNGGAGQYIVPMVSNEVQIAFINASSVIEMIRAQKLRALAVTTEKRLPELPNTPTMGEVGFPGIGTNAWQAIFVPIGTPKSIVDKLFNASVDALNNEELKEAFKKQLINPAHSKSPEDFNRFVQQEVNRWAGILSNLNVKAE